jgi:hypothetical protein
MATTNIQRQITRVSNLLRPLLAGLKQKYEKIKLGTIDSDELTDFKDGLYDMSSHVSTIDEYITKWTELIEVEDGDTLSEAYEKYMNEKSRPDDLAADASIFLKKCEHAILAYERQAIKTLPQTQSQPLIETPAQVQQTIVQNVEEIKLPNFYGNHPEWKTFGDLCEAIIEKGNYTQVQKWLKLTNHLKGKAAKIVEGLEVTDNSYREAMDLLNRRYDNNEIISDDLLEQWSALKPAKSVMCCL